MMLSGFSPAVSADDMAEVESVVSGLTRFLQKEEFKALTMKLGEVAGRVALRCTSIQNTKILLVTTAEDADDFARSVYNQLNNRGAEVSKACFWLDKVSAPVAEIGVGHRVVRSFIPPLESAPDWIVFCRSIMDSKSEWLVISSYLQQRFSNELLHMSVIAGVVTGCDRWPNGIALGEYLKTEPTFEYCAKEGSGLAFSGVSVPLHLRYGFESRPSLWRTVPHFVADEMGYAPEAHIELGASGGPRI